MRYSRSFPKINWILVRLNRSPCALNPFAVYCRVCLCSSPVVHRRGTGVFGRLGVACHAAGNLSPSVCVLVCLGSSVHLLWFASVLLGSSVLAVVVCCAPPSATLRRIMGVKQVRPCWVAHGSLQDMLVLYLLLRVLLLLCLGICYAQVAVLIPHRKKSVRLLSCLDV